jgi:hypothetical protein
MAKLKYLKLPKKPKAGASIKQLDAWLKRVDGIRKENAQRKSLNDQHERLSKRVAGIGSTYVTPGASRAAMGATRKKAAPKKTAAKKAAPKKAVKPRK